MFVKIPEKQTRPLNKCTYYGGKAKIICGDLITDLGLI